VPHMLAQEHFGIVNALQYGSTRNDATLAAALAAIGSQNVRLLLPFDGDGLWTLNNNWTIPANVVLEIPPGVHVTGAGQATINGSLLIYGTDSWNWHTRKDVVAGFGVATAFTATAMNCIYLNIGEPGAFTGLLNVRGNGGRPTIVTLEEGWDATLGSHGGGAAVRWRNLNTDRGFLGLEPSSNDMHLNLSGGAKFAVFGGNMGVGITPTLGVLQLGAGTAYMPGGGPWLSSSDARVKENVSLFTDGLAVVRQLNPKWYEYNGLGGMPHDGTRYVGFIGQDIESVAPYMVGHNAETKLYPDDPDPTDLYTVNAGPLSYILLNAIKEQQGLIDAQAALITTMQTAIDDLTTRLEALEAGPGTLQAPTPTVAARKRATK
jgi:Chaperone of endosialidase